MYERRLLGLILAQPRFPLNSTYPGAAGTIILDTLHSDRTGRFAAVTLGSRVASQDTQAPERVWCVDEHDAKWRLARKIYAAFVRKHLGYRQELMIAAGLVYALKSRANHIIVHTTKMNFAQAVAEGAPWAKTIIYHHTAEDQNRPELDVIGALRRCWGHIFVSRYAEAEFLKKAVELGFGSVRSRVVANRVNCERFRRDILIRENVRRGLGLKDEDVAVLFAGRMIRRKGFDILLNAVKGLSNANNARVVIVAVGARDYGETDVKGDYIPHWNEVEMLKSDGKMRIVGYRPPDEMASIMVACDALAFPIRQPEACGLVMLEAQACELPVIAPVIGGTAEYFVPGETGINIEPDDVESLRDALALLASRPELRRLMGGKGRALMVRRFNAKDYASDLIAALEGMGAEWAEAGNDACGILRDR